MSTTFEVANIEAARPEPFGAKLVDYLPKWLGKEARIEASSNTPNLVPTPNNGLITTIQVAFARHHPLTLSPDDIWFTIAQGLAGFINEHSEKLRKQLVSWEGKKEIEIERDEFILGGNNDWDGVFAEFSSLVHQHVGDEVYSLVGQSFTTSGPLQKAAHAITVMDAFKSYFDFSLKTLCGIPSITLEGSTEDWVKIIDAVRHFATLDNMLATWSEALIPFLEKFVEASNGKVDTTWWNSFYSENSMSGGPYITGHINNLFPFTTNKDQLVWRKNLTGTLTSDHYPKSLSQAPVKWKYYNTVKNMEFLAGLVGFEVTPEGIKPSFGWAVVEK